MSDAVTLQEFAGCLYEAPTAEGMKRDWRVDPTTGATYPFDLTKSEMSKMKLEGVPIKIEHALEGFSKGDEVGRVRESTTDSSSGYTAVKFALHDTIAGRTVSRLIGGGSIDSLSLGHQYDVATGAVTPSEVSVCFNGARPGTRIYKETQMYDRFKSNVQSRMEAVQETLSTDITTGHAKPQEPTIGTAGGQAAPVSASRKRNLADMLESVASHPGIDEGLITDFFQEVAGIVGERKTSTATNSEQRDTIDELKKKVASISEKNKADAGNIVATMNALLAEYAGPDAAAISCGADGETDLRSVAMSVPILASALSAHKQAAVSASVRVDSLAALRASLASDIKKAMSPFPGDASPSAERFQANNIAVNASGRGREAEMTERPEKAVRFAGMGLTAGQREALSGFGTYGAGTEPRISADMLPANFKGFTQGN